MSNPNEDTAIDLDAVPAEEDVNTADAPEALEQDPEEQPNFTDRHPEHFRNPPGHVSELREGDTQDS
jgi:hypothetical protein